METIRSSNLVLAIAPVSRGFGYAVFETLDVLVDWGINEVRGVAGRNARCVELVRTLLALHHPGAIALEDWRDERGRRSARVKTLLGLMADEAAAMQIRVALHCKADVRSVFAGQGARSKHDIARVVVRMMPELAKYLPRRRRPWESERYQMPMFEAAALGIAHLALADGTTLPIAA